MKPNRSVVGRFDVDELGRNPQIGGEVFGHRGAMLGDARRLGEDGDIGIDQFEAGRAHVRPHLTQEHSAVGTAISGIVVRKVLTDIAHPESAQHGVA